MAVELKPNKKAFLTKKIVISSITVMVLITIFLVMHSLLDFIRPYTIFIILALVILLLFQIINSFVSYSKEKYIILENKIILKKGSLISEHETELVIKNITQVWLNLPFLETKLFETGNVQIRAAGSADAEIYMRSIDNPKQIYDEISNYMEKNGFSLKRNKLIQKEKPKTIAVFFETFRQFLTILFAVILTIVFSLMPLFAEYPQYLPAAIIVLTIVIISLLLSSIFDFINLKRREYYVYKDLIEFQDGFFTENYSFIPIENIADTEITQTFLDKIFDLYDVVLSSQGSQNNVSFSNIANGKLLKKNIDELVRITPSLIDIKEKKKLETEVQIEKTAKTQTNSKLNYDTKTKQKKKTHDHFSLRMDMMRTIMLPIIFMSFFLVLSLITITILNMYVPNLFLSIPIIILVFITLLILWIIPSIFLVAFTTYSANSSRVEQTFNFLTSSIKEFSNEKITRVKIYENFIDKLFGTISIEFNSIGSGESIKFSNIKNENDIVKKILLLLEIEKEKIQQEIKSNFSITQFLKANIFGVLISTITIGILAIFNILGLFNSLIPILIILSAYAIAIIHRTIYYKTARLILYENYMYYTRGIFFKTHTYARYENIKDVEMTIYPSSNMGKIKFNVAGEIVSQSKNQKNYYSIGFTAHYIEQLEELHDKIDIILLDNPLLGIKQNLAHLKDPLTKEIFIAKPIKKNQLSMITFISVIIFPFILILPITLTIAYLILKNMSYSLKEGRIEKLSGVFYKSKLTILYNRLDHISSTQGLLNKMFKNGNIIIYTAGGSTAELTMIDIEKYNEMYKLIENKY